MCKRAVGARRHSTIRYSHLNRKLHTCLPDLFLAAKSAMAKAYAPYSKFPVGALRLRRRPRFSGANIEVASYPEGWCAETTALGHYIMGGGGKITEVAVIAERMAKVTPCGGCRQRLARVHCGRTPNSISATRPAWSRRSRWATCCPTVSQATS